MLLELDQACTEMGLNISAHKTKIWNYLMIYMILLEVSLCGCA